MTGTGLKNIGLFGNAYVGKSHVADVLVRAYGYERVSFAGEVKQTTVAMVRAGLDYLGFRGEFDFDTLNRNKAFFRPLLQFVGTELGRQWMGNDRLWIDKLLAKTATGGPYVVDDLRFLNEGEALVRAGWQVVQVDASLGTVLRRSHLSAHEVHAMRQHASERQIDDIRRLFDAPTLVNNGLSDEQITAFFDALVGAHV